MSAGPETRGLDPRRVARNLIGLGVQVEQRAAGIEPDAAARQIGISVRHFRLISQGKRAPMAAVEKAAAWCNAPAENLKVLRND